MYSCGVLGKSCPQQLDMSMCVHVRRSHAAAHVVCRAFSRRAMDSYTRRRRAGSRGGRCRAPPRPSPRGPPCDTKNTIVPGHPIVSPKRKLVSGIGEAGHGRGTRARQAGPARSAGLLGSRREDYPPSAPGCCVGVGAGLLSGAKGKRSAERSSFASASVLAEVAT